jgi:hypothetical protein
MVGDDSAEVLRVTTLPTAGLHQHGNPGVVFDNQVQHHLIAVGALIATVAAGNMDDRLLRLLVTVVAAIDMNTGAIEMGQAGRKPQTCGSGRGKEAVEFRHPVIVKRIPRTAERVIIAMVRLNTRGDASRERLVLKKMRHQGKPLVDKAQAIQDHGFDGMACSDNPHCRVVLRCLINNLSDTKCFKHACDEPQVISNLRAVRLRLWRDVRTVRLSHSLLLCRGDCIDTPKLLNYM